jgi:hypothetical protein
MTFTAFTDLTFCDFVPTFMVAFFKHLWLYCHKSYKNISFYGGTPFTVENLLAFKATKISESKRM